MSHKIVEIDNPKIVNYEFWGDMPGWTVSEAAALLLDLDPDLVSEEAGSEWPVRTQDQQYHRLRRRLERARLMEDLDDPMRPVDFIEWAISNKLTVSDALKASVKTSKNLKNWRAKYFSMKRKRDALVLKLKDVTTPKERTSLLTIILAMVRQTMKHKAGNPHTVSTIQKAVEKSQLKLGDDTIRKFIDEAEEKLEV